MTNFFYMVVGVVMLVVLWAPLGVWGEAPPLGARGCCPHKIFFFGCRGLSHPGRGAPVACHGPPPPNFFPPSGPGLGRAWAYGGGAPPVPLRGGRPWRFFLYGVGPGVLGGGPGGNRAGHPRCLSGRAAPKFFFACACVYCRGRLGCAEGGAP